MRRRDFIYVLGGAGLIFAKFAHAADNYPIRPIRVVVPYPPGGGTDIVARIVGERLQASLGQPVVIDNRGGAAGVIGTGLVAKAEPDGYTLLLAPSSHVINPSIHANLPYDTVKAFAPITTVGSTAILMATNPRVPAHSMRELVEAAKAQPQSIATYGSAGVGTVFHLTGQLFNQLSGLTLQHIPYRGGAPTVAALLSGEVPIAFETMLSLGPHVRAGTLRALAVTSAQRSSAMPEIPTAAEAGFPALVADNWYALFAPAGTPDRILARLHDATVAALASPDVRDKLREQGAEVVGDSSAELAAHVVAEIPKWTTLARQAGVTPQ
jgi:tripartite-type tricarboxylate transporter receptor subunit TctC